MPGLTNKEIAKTAADLCAEYRILKESITLSGMLDIDPAHPRIISDEVKQIIVLCKAHYFVSTDDGKHIIGGKDQIKLWSDDLQHKVEQVGDLGDRLKEFIKAVHARKHSLFKSGHLTSFVKELVPPLEVANLKKFSKSLLNYMNLINDESFKTTVAAYTTINKSEVGKYTRRMANTDYFEPLAPHEVQSHNKAKKAKLG